MITLKNDFASISVSPIGAELKSFKTADAEYIWHGDENHWKMSCPLLFPICGALKGDCYYLDGKKYPMQKHGYIRFEEFSLESQTQNSLTFLSRSNEETLKTYPFEYELRVIYTLTGKKLSVKYDIKNLSNDTMYFSIGGHDGYSCPEGIEEYELIFPQKETLFSSIVGEGGLNGEKIKIIENSDRLSLKYDYFTQDALIFEDMASRSMILRNVNTDRQLKIEFDGFDYFLVWTNGKAKSPFICLEAWKGIVDDCTTDQNLKTKRGIEKVEKGKNYVCERFIEILK